MGFLLRGGPRKSALGRQDWALLVIGAADGLLPVQLQKSLFLLRQRFPEQTQGGYYEFRPVAAGNFSEQIYLDVDSLSKTGLVSIRSGRDGNRQYKLTAAGTEKVKKLEKQVPPAIEHSLQNLVSWVKRRSIDQLLRTSADSTGSMGPGAAPYDAARLR